MPKMSERKTLRPNIKRKSTSSDDGATPAKMASQIWSDEKGESVFEDPNGESDFDADEDGEINREIDEDLVVESSDEEDKGVRYQDSGTGQEESVEEFTSLSESGNEDSGTSGDDEEETDKVKKGSGYSVKNRDSEATKKENNDEEKVDAGDDNNVKVKIDLKSAFDGYTKTYTISVESQEVSLCDVNAFFSSTQNSICRILGIELFKLGNIKASFHLNISFVDNEFDEFHFNATITVSKEEDLKPCYKSAQKTIVSKFKDFKSKNAGEIQILYLNLHIYEKDNVNNSFIDLPSHLEQDVVLFKDNLSFKWAVLAGLHPEIDCSSYHTLESFSKDLILDGIEHPVGLNDIAKVEERNDISINVFVLKYVYENKKEEIEGPVYHTERRRDTHLNLLLLYDENQTHYCYIKNLNRSVDPSQKGPICDGCLCFFKDKNTLQRHQMVDCFRVKTVMPSDTETYVDNNQDIPMPIVVYADFEALLEPVKNNVVKPKEESNNQTNTTNVSKHVPYSFAYYVKCFSNEKLSRLKTYYGLDCEEVFLQKLISTLKRTLKHFRNLQIKDIPVFFHNFRNYDGHFVIKGMATSPGSATALGSKDNFIAIHKRISINDKDITLRFLDSYNFLKGSIETLAENLDRDKFYESRRYWSDVDDDAFTLLTQKGVFPYGYITSKDKLKETSLPKKKHFYDSLKTRDISDDDYKRALKVWQKFSCDTILDYSMIYLKVDVLLLADLFENLRRTCLKTYKIDPARYYSMSALSWDAMLKMTEVKLQLLTDVDMLAFLKRAMRGGIAHCTQRRAVANNKYLPGTYEPGQNDSYLMYYDANNLYGWAMSQPLPYGGFKWVDTDVDFNVHDDSDIGYFLEVDLEYPDDKQLHKLHADYPFCPEKKIVSGVDCERQITDFTSKEHYVLHHSYLKQCVKNGLRVMKIHRILKFNQKPWLKPYIDFNTLRRAKAANASEKDFYKLMNNSIYGKTVRNIEKDLDVKIATHWLGDKYNRGGNYFTRQPEYHSHVIASRNTIAVQLNKTKRVYKTPVYVGYSVLDLAKSHMYEFHYGFMKKKFGENVKLLYTDTDSFVYQISTEDYYSDMIESLGDYFDTSNYPKDNKFGYPQLNEKSVGFFKDECEGAVMKEFVALRPKVYMIEAEGGIIIRKAQSAPKEVKEQFTIEDYKRCLNEQKPLIKEWVRFRAERHEVYTQRVRGAVLRPDADCKRHWLEDNLNSLPYGHYRLKGMARVDLE